MHSKLLKLCGTVSSNLTIFKIVLVLSCFPTALICHASSAETKKAPEYLVKAVYLFKFLSFVQWPDNGQSTTMQEGNITIGILGDDPLSDHFQPIEGHVIKSINKKVAIKHLGPYRDGMDLKQCQLLFICSSEEKKFKRIINRTKGTAILTVADTKGFLELGGMVNLVNINGHIRWEIDLSSIRQAGLNVSSTFVQSAERVIYVLE